MIKDSVKIKSLKSYFIYISIDCILWINFTTGNTKARIKMTK